MSAQSPSPGTFISTLEKPNPQVMPSASILSQGVIESFFDGILILTEQGQLIQANNLACQICKQLTQTKLRSNQDSWVPQEVWHVCQSLIESRSSYHNQPVIIESEITNDNSKNLRIRVQWIKLNATKSPCLVVILEDRYQFAQNLAIAAIDKYGLTPREAEVWLLRRANYTYKEIAAQLYISLNTVKKHLKNIHAKGSSHKSNCDRLTRR